jgi:hypothetical protein
MNDHHESYGSDHILDMNEQYVVKNLPRNHYQMLFTLRMYDDDTLKEDELIDISPTDTYNLEVFFDVVTGMWAVWKDMDKVKGTTYEKTYLESASNLLEGVYLYRNANDTYNVIRETDKGKPVAGVKDGIGYVTGYEKKGDDLGEAGGIQFEIIPCDRNNKTVGIEYFDHYQDFDYDGLTSLSEWFWSNYTFFHNGKEMRYGNLSSMVWDSDVDMLSDGWEIRYGFDPLSDNSPDKNDDDGDNDGIKDHNEYYLGTPEIKVLKRTWMVNKTINSKDITCRVHDMGRWGAQPDRQDIFVEVDWMKNNKTGKEYKMSNGAKEIVILSFFRACKYGVNITLHIDDGCMGGGMNNTKYFKHIFFNKDDAFADYYSIEWYYDNSIYFSDIRENVFHYCIFGDNYAKYPTGGKGKTNGDKGYFAVFKSYGKSDERNAHVFYHELGHNLFGYYHNTNNRTLAKNNINQPFNGTPNGNNKQINYYILTEKNYNNNLFSWTHCPNKCAMEQGSDYLDYCCNCWNSIKIDLLLR